MPLVLLCSAAADAFDLCAAARSLDVELIDVRHVLPAARSQRGVVATTTARAVAEALAGRAPDGVVALDGRGALLAATVAEAVGLAWHTPGAVRSALDAVRARGALLAAGLPVPWFFTMGAGDPVGGVADRLSFPCRVVPLAEGPSARGTRARSPAEFDTALAHLQGTGGMGDDAAHESERDPARGLERDGVLVEADTVGRSFTLGGFLEHGLLRVVAIAEHLEPGPLAGAAGDLAVTPCDLEAGGQRAIAAMVAHAAAAIGLRHGPVQAACVAAGPAGTFVRACLPFPIGAPLADGVRFAAHGREGVTLGELTLRHALGAPLDAFGREAVTVAVLSLRRREGEGPAALTGWEAAAAVPGVARARPAPAGSTDLGWVMTHGPTAAEVTRVALDAARRLQPAGGGEPGGSGGSGRERYLAGGT